MRTISATLGLETPISTRSLAIDPSGLDVNAPLSVKEESRIPRVERAELEAAYMMDGVTFNTINTAAELIMSAGHVILAEDKDTLRFFEVFLDRIGNVGSILTWEGLVTRIMTYEMIYGDILVERIQGEGGKTIDLDVIDPKRHDYAKNRASKIALDKFGRPIGYTQSVDPYKSLTRKAIGDKKPREITLDSNMIFLPAGRISHFKLFTVGDALQGIGYIEPAYKTILRKLNVQKAQGDSAYRHSTPLFHATVGDDNHEPTPQIIDNILAKLKKARENYDISFPYFVKLDLLEPKNSEAITHHLQYLGKEGVSPSGTPLPFASGGGEATNRATLRDQARLYEIKLQWLAEHVAHEIEHLIFRPISEEYDLPEVPKIKWGPVGLDRKERTSELLLKFVQAGILGIDEVRHRINELGILEIDPNKIPVLPEPAKKDRGGQDKPPFSKEDRIREDDEE